MTACVLVTQSCPTLCNPMDCSPPGSSVHGIFQARLLEWVAISFSRGSPQPRNRTQISWIAGRFLTLWATGEATNDCLIGYKRLALWSPEVGKLNLQFMFLTFSMGQSKVCFAWDHLWLFLPLHLISFILLKSFPKEDCLCKSPAHDSSLRLCF